MIDQAHQKNNTMLNILCVFKSPPKDILTLIDSHKVEFLQQNKSLTTVLSKKNYDLILLDGTTNDLQAIKTTDPRVEVILFGDSDPIEAISQGAYAHFPYTIDTERIKGTIDNVTEMIMIRRKNAILEKQLIKNYTFFSGVVGRNPQMLEIFTFIRRIAPYYRIVTIFGDTGTGKEVIARSIHALSPVSKNPFVVCDCGSLVHNLVESELFGHKKGSFTGAITDKIGLFESVGEGTLFLDEIGELHLSSQASLLRVLQSGEFRRIGDNQQRKTKCKIITATNKDLMREVKRGNFREDLYYRVIPLKIQVPTLSERKDDVPLLAKYFLERFSLGTGKEVMGISRTAQTIMMLYDWPGNVRELENVVEQAAILTTEVFIRVDDLPHNIKETSFKSFHVSLSLDDMIRKHIERVLKECGGNRSKASEMLGMNRRSLLRKLKKYSIH